MSSIYWSLYYALTQLFAVPRRTAVLVALVTCLYPPLLLRASFAWAENAYVPAFIVLAVLFGVLMRHKSLRYAVAFGLLLGFMYTIQPRSLAILPVAAVYLVLLGYFRGLPWRAVSAALGTTALALAGTRILIEHLKTAGGNQVLENEIRIVFTHFFSLRGIFDLFINLNQQLLYLVLSTFGLFLVGVLAIGCYYWQRRDEWFKRLCGDATYGALVFYLLAWFASMALNAAHPYGMPVEGGQLLKGRYVGGNSALILALGFTALLGGVGWAAKRGLPARLMGMWALRPLAIVVVLVAISTAIVVFGVYAFEPVVTPTNALGVYPFFHFFGSPTTALVVASALAAIGFAVYSLVRNHLRYAATVAIAGLFLLFSAYANRYAILPAQERFERSATLAAYIREHLDSPAYIAYDLSHYHPLTYSSYGYLLPHTRLVSFKSALGEKPAVPIVISSRNWSDAEALDAEFWQAEPHLLFVGADQVLWTLPGETQTMLLEHVDYSNTVLGPAYLPAWNIETNEGRLVQSTWGVRQEGFLHPLESSEDFPPVWVNRSAWLRVPNGKSPPQSLLLNFVSTVRRDTALQVTANGQTLFADAIPPGNWCESFPLATNTSASHTDVTLRVPPLPDTATGTLPANIVVRGITLLDHLPERQRGLTADPLPPDGFRSQIAVETPAPARLQVHGATSIVRLTVANTSDHPWPTLCELGQTPGTVQLGLLWFPLHSDDRTFAARIAEGRAAIPYALAPGRSISIAAFLAPIALDGNFIPPGEYEIWLGPVQEGVAWFFERGDDVLKLHVKVVR